MDPRVIVERKAIALERIERAEALLHERLGIDPALAGAMRKAHSDPETAVIHRLEATARLLESLTAQAAGAGRTKKG